MSTVELSSAPRLGPLYRNAVLAALLRKGGGDGLPEAELVLREVTVDRSHLAAYDRVCGFRLTDQLPATYPHVLAFPLAVALMTHADFPLPLVGLVHVANRIEQHRPLRAEERFALRVRAEGLRPYERGGSRSASGGGDAHGHRGGSRSDSGGGDAQAHRGRQVDLVAEVLDDADEVVWAGRSTYLRRETAHRASTAQRGGGERPELPRPSAVWRLTPRVGTDYADVSGDHNPIHTSWLGARLFGFPGPIAHGMWSKARCLAALEGRLPEAYTVDVAFKLPIRLPGRVAFSASDSASDGGSWKLGLHDVASGKPHLSGTVGVT